MKGIHSTLFTLAIPTFFGLFNPAESAKVPLAANRASARHVFSNACYQWNIQTSWSILAWCRNDEGQYGKTIIALDDVLANDYGVLVAKYKGDLSYSCATCGPGTTWGMVTCLCGNGKGVDVYSSIDLGKHPIPCSLRLSLFLLTPVVSRRRPRGPPWHPIPQIAHHA